MMDFNNQVLTSLEEMSNRLQRIEAASALTMPLSPPGLCNEINNMPEFQFPSIHRKLDEISDCLKLERDNVTAAVPQDIHPLVQRIELLAKVYVLTDWETLEEAASLVQVRPPHTESFEQPEAEMSPARCPCPRECTDNDKLARTIHFNIFDKSDDEALMLIATGTQTLPMKSIDQAAQTMPKPCAFSMAVSSFLRKISLLEYFGISS